jgi:pyridoxine 5-phosphate synthase
MAGLIVDIEQASQLRKSPTESPSLLVASAMLAEMAGAEGIAVSLSPAYDLIRERDLKLLRETIQTQLLLQMPPSTEMVGIALDIKPDRVTLIPQRREEKTSEGGFDLIIHKENVSETVRALQNSGIPVGIRIDPDPEQVKLAHQINVDGVTLFTGAYAGAATPHQAEVSYHRLVDAIKLAAKLRLLIHAEGGLNPRAVNGLRTLADIATFVIGHSLVAKALLVGMQAAVAEMVALVRSR